MKKVTINRIVTINNIDFILFMFLSVYPLIDFLILSCGFPIVTTLFYTIFFIINYRNIKISLFAPVVLVSCYLVCLFYNGILNGWLHEYELSIVVLIGTLFSTLVLFEKDNCYKYLISFTYIYFILSVLVFYYRFIREGMNFLAARGGATFYGGNTGHLILLVMFFLAVYLGKRKDAIVLFFLSCFNAILFTSKGAIVTQIFILFYFFLDSYKLKFKQVILMIIGLLSLYFLAESLSWLEINKVLLYRFMIWQDSMESGYSFLGTRLMIWGECIDIIKNDGSMFFWGCGLGKFNYINHWGYSNPHNILLDVLFGAGIFGLLTFIYICINTLISATHNRVLYLLVIIYGVFEGISLFFVDLKTSLIWGTALIFILCCYDIVKKYNLEIMR